MKFVSAGSIDVPSYRRRPESKALRALKEGKSPERYGKEMKAILKALQDSGLADSVSCLEQINYLLYLRILDQPEPHLERQLYPSQGERYRWRKWAPPSSNRRPIIGSPGNDPRTLHNFLGSDVFPYMASLIREAPQVAEYFRDATLRIDDPATLYHVVQVLDSIPFENLYTEDVSEFYQGFLSRIDIDSKQLYPFSTPRQIRAFMLDMLDPDFEDTICDPVCGTGEFLTDSVEYLLAKYSKHPVELPIYGSEWLASYEMTLEEAKSLNPYLQTYWKGSGDRMDSEVLRHSIFGFDSSRQMVRTSVMNMKMHGVDKPKLARGNLVLADDGLTENELMHQYDIILSNPLFENSSRKESLRTDLPTKSANNALRSLGLMMMSLAPGGRCAMIVPQTLLSGSTKAHIELRQSLVSDFDVQAIVSLPVGTFRQNLQAASFKEAEELDEEIQALTKVVSDVDDELFSLELKAKASEAKSLNWDETYAAQLDERRDNDRMIELAHRKLTNDKELSIAQGKKERLVRNIRNRRSHPGGRAKDGWREVQGRPMETSVLIFRRPIDARVQFLTRVRHLLEAPLGKFVDNQMSDYLGTDEWQEKVSAEILRHQGLRFYNQDDEGDTKEIAEKIQAHDLDLNLQILNLYGTSEAFNQVLDNEKPGGLVGKIDKVRSSWSSEYASYLNPWIGENEAVEMLDAASDLLAAISAPEADKAHKMKRGLEKTLGETRSISDIFIEVAQRAKDYARADYDVAEMKLGKLNEEKKAEIDGRVMAEQLFDPQSGEVLIDNGEEISEDNIDILERLGTEKIQVRSETNYSVTRFMKDSDIKVLLESGRGVVPGGRFTSDMIEPLYDGIRGIRECHTMADTPTGEFHSEGDKEFGQFFVDMSDRILDEKIEFIHADTVIRKVQREIVEYRRSDAYRMSETVTKKVWFYSIISDEEGTPMSSSKPFGPKESRWEYHAQTPSHMVFQSVFRIDPERHQEIPKMLEAWKAYQESDFKQPPGKEAGTILEPGEEPPACWWVDVEMIAANDYNLASERYQPLISQHRTDEDPVQLIKEILNLEHEFVGDLERLLSDIQDEP